MESKLIPEEIANMTVYDAFMNFTLLKHSVLTREYMKELITGTGARRAILDYTPKNKEEKMQKEVFEVFIRLREFEDHKKDIDYAPFAKTVRVLLNNIVRKYRSMKKNKEFHTHRVFGNFVFLMSLIKTPANREICCFERYRVKFHKADDTECYLGEDVEPQALKDFTWEKHL